MCPRCAAPTAGSLRMAANADSCRLASVLHDARNLFGEQICLNFVPSVINERDVGALDPQTPQLAAQDRNPSCERLWRC